MLTCAVLNEKFRTTVLEYLLKRNPNLHITSELLLLAAGSWSPDQAIMITQTLLARDPTLQSSEEILQAAIGYYNRDVLQCMLDHQPSLLISQSLIEYATRRRSGVAASDRSEA